MSLRDLIIIGVLREILSLLNSVSDIEGMPEEITISGGFQFNATKQ